MPSIGRFAALSMISGCALLGLSGCSDGPALPTASGSVPAPSAHIYSLRTDLMVIAPAGPDGAPKRWPTPGFHPLFTVQFPHRSPDREFAEDLRPQLNRTLLDPNQLSADQANRLRRLLDRYFGTPFRPLVAVPAWEQLMVLAQARPSPEQGVLASLGQLAGRLRAWDPADRQKLQGQWRRIQQTASALQLEPSQLARGAAVYRRWCLACHGPTGAGNGQYAVSQSAWPRDYRQGLFKFITAAPPPDAPRIGRGPAGKPRRDDLKRVVRRGIDGSMMPPFPHLSEAELDDLISYVIHLSVRGETEFATIAKALQPTEEDPDFTGPELDWLFVQNLLNVLDNWRIAAEHPLQVPPQYLRSEEDRLLSAMRGYKLYNSAEFGCASCHVKYGTEPQLKWDLWGGVVQPRNLLLGVYRGGRRGEDLYARLYIGIHASGMPSFRQTLATGPSYPERPDKIWNVVHFLQALADPYDRQRLQDPLLLERFKAQLRQQGDLFLDDLARITIEP